MSDEYSYRDFFRNRRENGLWVALKDDHERTYKGSYVILGASFVVIGLGFGIEPVKQNGSTVYMIPREYLLVPVGIGAVVGLYLGNRAGRFLRRRWSGMDRRWYTPRTSENVSGSRDDPSSGSQRASYSLTCE